MFSHNIFQHFNQTPTGLVYTLNDARGASSTPTELIALVASQHCKRQTAKQVELTKTKSRKKQRSALSPVTGLKKRPYCPKPAQPPHIATGESISSFIFLTIPRSVLFQSPQPGKKKKIKSPAYLTPDEFFIQADGARKDTPCSSRDLRHTAKNRKNLQNGK